MHTPAAVAAHYTDQCLLTHCQDDKTKQLMQSKLPNTAFTTPLQLSHISANIAATPFLNELGGRYTLMKLGKP